MDSMMLQDMAVAVPALAALAVGLGAWLWHERGARRAAQALLVEREAEVGKHREQAAAAEAKWQGLLGALDELRRQSAEQLRSREQQLERAALALRSQGDQLASVQARLALADAGVAARERQLQEQQRWIAEQNARLEERFQLIAGQLLEEKSLRFAQSNREQIDALLLPLKSQLQEFRSRVDEVYKNDSDDRSALRQHIGSLTALNQTLSRETRELTRALTTSSKHTGNWGEVVLRRILEDSALREGHEYLLQQSVKPGPGAPEALQRQQPDAVILLPDNRRVIVDAKTSLKAWTSYAAEEDEGQRLRARGEHIASLRGHLRSLAAADYPGSPDLAGSVEFVLMFVPVEAALLEALAAEPGLYAEAQRSNVVMVVPSTLFAVVRLIDSMWSVQRQSDNARQIADAGRKLHDKLVSFCESFVGLGEMLTRTQQQFDKARGQLSQGPGNAIRLAERMRELGVSSQRGRSLPASLLAASAAQDDDSADHAR